MFSINEVKDAYKEIKKNYKRGNLDSLAFLKKFAEFRKKLSEGPKVPNEKFKWSSRVLIFEIEDYLGIEGHNEKWEKEFRVFAESPDKMGPARSSEEISVLKSKVRCAIAGIHIIYQKHTYKQALEETEKLEMFIKVHLHNETRRSHGLLGMLKYMQGKIYRQQGAYDDAIECFNEAILAYHERAASKSTELSGVEEIKSEQSFSLVRIAWCVGFGLGFTYFTRGDILNSQFMVVSALSIMAPHGYEIYQNNLRILKAGIRRAAIASYKDVSQDHKLELESLEGEIGECLKIFKEKDIEQKDLGRRKSKYNKYQLRALFELALIRYYLTVSSNENEVEKYELAPTLGELTNSGEDSYWKAQALIIKGHLFCHQENLEEAGKIAEHKLLTSLSEDANLSLIKIGTLLLKGKVFFLKREFLEAERFFNEALDESKMHSRFKIIAQLRLVDCALEKNEYNEALKLWEGIDSAEIGLQYAYVKKAFDNTEKVIAKLKETFLIFNADDVFASKEKIADRCMNQLKGWLCVRAFVLTGGSWKKMSKLLGKDEDTIKSWMRKTMATNPAGDVD